MRLSTLASVWRDPLALVGGLIAGGWVAVAIAAPVIAPHDPQALGPDLFQPPSGVHLFGTDELGRDLLARVIWGARISIPWAIALVVISLVVGSALGATAAYFGGKVDEGLMRFTDLVFAFPTIILALAVSAALGAGLRNALIAIALVSWPPFARVVRAQVLTLMQADFTLVTRLLGVPAYRALLRDVLPNVAGPALVLATLNVGNKVLLLSSLSFLGVAVQPPEPEWGSMVATGAHYFDRWWLGAFPGLAIMSVVLASNLIGDSLRDWFDPYTSASRDARQV